MNQTRQIGKRRFMPPFMAGVLAKLRGLISRRRPQNSSTGAPVVPEINQLTEEARALIVDKILALYRHSIALSKCFKEYAAIVHQVIVLQSRATLLEARTVEDFDEAFHIAGIQNELAEVAPLHDMCVKHVEELQASIVVEICEIYESLSVKNHGVEAAIIEGVKQAKTQRPDFSDVHLRFDVIQHALAKARGDLRNMLSGTP
jgi:hypothetical protein